MPDSRWGYSKRFRYLQSMLKLPWLTVNVPFALIAPEASATGEARNPRASPVIRTL